MSSTWRLMLRDALIGEIEITDSDFPWLSGTFVARPGFAEVKPLFDEELSLLESEDYRALDDVYYRIRGTGLRLFAPDGHEVPEFLLHIREREAWFRYSDEPFPPPDDPEQG
jgi:hypothetical protein